MRHEKAVKKLMPPKRPPKGFKKCSFLLSDAGKIEYVMIPAQIFHEQFDNFNEQNLFFEVFEYIEEINEG